MESSVPENLIITDREEVLALDDREYVKHGLSLCSSGLKVKRMNLVGLVCIRNIQCDSLADIR
jgi:hypothetical protein